MAEQPSELQRINWSECFSCTQLLRSFRIAVSPTKLGLAFAGLVLMGLWGAILDGVWSCSSCRPLEGEVNAFWQVSGIDAWREAEKGLQAERLRGVYVQLAKGRPAEEAADLLKAGEAAAKELGDEPEQAIKSAMKGMRIGYKEAIEAVEKKRLDDHQERQEKAAEAGRFNALARELGGLGPKGVFASFLGYETGVVRQMLDAARGLNFTGQIDLAISGRGRAAEEGFVPSVKTGPEGIGVLASVVLMLRGVQWLWVEHWLFAILALLGSLGIWGLFGGAVCRMAALNVARDEQISMKAAMQFAMRKWLSFVSAPLLPVGLVILIGICLFLGGLFMSIPYLGDVVGGLGFGLALLGGFVMALVAVGALAALSLMWPTIAMEGSDAFDAMSRSYSYVFARPWRAGLYAVVALVYGSLCYLFARFFVLVLLKMTRTFVGFGMAYVTGYRPGTGIAGATKIDALWPHPSFERLVPDAATFSAAGGGDVIGRFFVCVWTLILVGLLCAFLVTFFLSASTIAYCLLRRKVDATDLEDVYVEEDEEEEPLPAAPASPAMASAAPSAPGPAAPPPEGPSCGAGGSDQSTDTSADEEEP